MLNLKAVKTKDTAKDNHAPLPHPDDNFFGNIYHLKDDVYVLPCECGTEAVMLYLDKEGRCLEISIWYYGRRTMSVWDRIRFAWRCLLGDPYKDQICLSVNQVKELGELLSTISKEVK